MTGEEADLQLSRHPQKMVFCRQLPWNHACVIIVLCLGITSALTTNTGSTRKPIPATGSILDIINIQEVERLLDARRGNASREERRFLGQNALDDYEIYEQEESKDEPDSEDDIRQQLNVSGMRKATVKPPENPRRSYTVGIDTLLRKGNESFPYKPPEILAELSGFSGDKLLKSSKNALLVTKKEYLKRDWCKTEPLVQRIREDGCQTRTVINRFCYGQCNSFYIPKNPRRRRARRRDSDEEENESSAPAFKSCAFCKPKKASWITVTLNCPSLSPQIRKKRILRIKQCKCITEVFN
ncbi:uncharacterized protein [Periplaneta americana]|uniref:uncharacterized protein isoform X2 n=1 Tax=Periplaneta americana TaxID=6978 RepID=UPI0037E8667F